MIEVYWDIETTQKRSVDTKIQDKLIIFIDYITDYIIELNNLGETWLYEYIFPKYLLKQKRDLCIETIETLHDWINDEYTHKLNPIQEYAIYNILQYCKSIDIEFIEEQGKSLFDMKYGEFDNIYDKINTFDFYEVALFEDYDFLDVATFYELYKNNNKLFELLNTDLDEYVSLMPLDIQEEYENIKEKTKENNMGEDEMKISPKVFISYSWDSEIHKSWVKQLWQTLRDYGINATIDQVETQYGTVNLNHMMVEKIRDSDYTIVVLTEEYARKAESLKGGVGRETNFLYNYLMENTKKIIPIVRSGGQNSVPFYLQGLYYIDFSDDNNLKDSFKELLRIILNQPKIEVTELGQVPQLEAEKVQAFDFSINDNRDTDMYEDLIPNLCNIAEPTELDKNRFIKESYIQLKEKLSGVLDLTKERNNGFQYEIEEHTSLKSIIRVYLNGINKYNLKIWVSSGFGGRDLTINMSYGNYISDSDSSMNEMIRCEVSENNKLFLNMMMNYSISNKQMTADDIFKVIWQNILDNLK